MERFRGKAAIVTGGGSGIGAACCRRLAVEGARVGVLDRNFTAARQVAEAINAEGREAHAVAVDVTDQPALARAINQAAQILGGLDVAVNNAGIGGDNSKLEETAFGFWDETIAINLSGVYYSMRAEFPLLVERGGGAIINMASILGAVGFPDAAPYIAAKHGVIGLTRCAALSWAKHNIRVTAVCPTFIRTLLTAALPEDLWPDLIARHPLGALPSADDVAAMAAYLASHEASAVTGSMHIIDVGYTAG